MFDVWGGIYIASLCVVAYLCSVVVGRGIVRCLIDSPCQQLQGIFQVPLLSCPYCLNLQVLCPLHWVRVLLHLPTFTLPILHLTQLEEG